MLLPLFSRLRVGGLLAWVFSPLRPLQASKIYRHIIENLKLEANGQLAWAGRAG